MCIFTPAIFILPYNHPLVVYRIKLGFIPMVVYAGNLNVFIQSQIANIS